MKRALSLVLAVVMVFSLALGVVAADTARAALADSGTDSGPVDSGAVYTITFTLNYGTAPVSKTAETDAEGKVTAKMMVAGMPFGLAVLLGGVGVGALLGAINGALINFTKLHPFIITLGTQSIFRGVTMIISDAKPIFGFPQSFKTAFGGMIGGKIPMPVVWALLVAAILWFVTTKSKMGRNFYALGGNKEAAWFSGINVRLHTLLVHIISGICAGICGVVMIARLGSAEPMAGSGHETFAIAAAIIGGTSFFGGKGKIPNVIVGALIIGLINNALNMLSVETYFQQVATGALIIGAVTLDMFISRKK